MLRCPHPYGRGATQHLLPSILSGVRAFDPSTSEVRSFVSRSTETDMTKSIHDEMSRSEVKTFAELVRKKGCKLPLTEHEQSRYLELREEYNSGIGPEQRERLERAAALAAGTPLWTLSREKLLTCLLTAAQVDLYDLVRGLLHNGEPVTTEQRREYDTVCRLVARCWGGGGSPPDDDDGEPDFERSIGDVIAAARSDDGEEANQPSPVIPGVQPSPVLPDLMPKAAQKRKGKPRASSRDGGWGRD